MSTILRAGFDPDQRLTLTQKYVVACMHTQCITALLMNCTFIKYTA